MVGTGDMQEDGWEKLGVAGSLEEAMHLMLNNSKYAKEGSILFYSDYSYDDTCGVRCGTAEMVNGRDLTDNPNWQQYQLSFDGMF